MNSKIIKYIIISTAKNEMDYIGYTLHSVVSQTIKPVAYIVVNDGSSDCTESIINRYAQTYPWIKQVKLTSKGGYRYGDGVISAFYAGYNVINDDYNYLVKLDCDLSFEENYFEKLFAEFNANIKLGIVSGQTYYLTKGKKLVWEDAPLDHTLGPSKVYSRECFESINGLIQSIGWDHVDEVNARMKGWQTRSFPQLKVIHHRKMGSRMGIIRGNIRHARADYITGYHPLYFLLKTVYRLFSRPFIIGSFMSLYSFGSCYVLRRDRIVNRSFIKYYRNEQLSKLRNANFWKVYLIIFGFRKYAKQEE